MIMKNLSLAMWFVFISLMFLYLALTSCSAVMDMRRDCDVLVEKLRDAKPAELWSVSQVYRANGCTDSRHLTPDAHEWVKTAR